MCPGQLCGSKSIHRSLTTEQDCNGLKAELNLLKYRLVPKIKLTLLIVLNICRIGQFKIGGNRPSLIDRCQILSPIQQRSMQQCTGYNILKFFE